MIVVRDIFRLKFGKAKDALEILKKMKPLIERSGVKGMRVLTDLTGASYTLVLEVQQENLKSFEETLGMAFADKEWQELYKQFVPLVESGERQIFTLREI
ncbi:MAG: NIPSNAP family protein [Ignavibacteria bacterium]|nr:NIPSNAP family protein [Ignavibacteria bacterium]